MGTVGNLIRDAGLVANSTSVFSCYLFLKCATRMLIRLNEIPTACLSFQTSSVSVYLGVKINQRRLTAPEVM